MRYLSTIYRRSNLFYTDTMKLVCDIEYYIFFLLDQCSFSCFNIIDM